MGLFGTKNKILLKERFNSKYKLIITSDIQTGNMSIKTKAEIRWNVKVKKIADGNIYIEIITLDNQLVESNNPLAKDIANMSQLFAKMYSELDLVITQKARLKHIRNMDLIKEKWNWIKNDLKEVQDQDPMISHVINLNEAQLSDDKILFEAINNNEFFQLYFHQLYGSPYHGVTNSVYRKNILNTILLEWQYRIDKVETNNHEFDVFALEGFVETSKSDIKASYKDYSHLELKKLTPEITEKGRYHLDPISGKIVKARLTKKEIVHPQLLHATINYELTNE